MIKISFKYFLTVSLLLFLCPPDFAQQNAVSDANKAKANDEFYNGNEAYKQGDYKNALSKYETGLKSNPGAYAGNFNAGNSNYNLKNFDTARTSYSHALTSASSKAEKANAYHNIGNTYLQQKKWKEAIDAYKSALRNVPNDMDTKYNLAYAQKMLKNDQDKNKDKKNKQDNQQQQNKKDNKDQNNNDQPKNNGQDQQQPQFTPGNISQQQAEKILNALRQQEAKLLQDKNAKEKAPPHHLDKDW